MNFYSKIFKKKKNIPLDQFINKALYDSEYGYYTKRNPFGSKGDFVTSPNISILFSEAIAVWCVSFWEKLEKPNPINIVELGPGNGTLAKGLIQSFNNFNKFKDKYRIYLHEKSRRLKKIQKKTIASKNVKWINNFNEIKKGPVIIIANEFFDSLPIKQYVYKNKNWYEKYVELKNYNTLNFLYKRVSLPNFKKICKLDISKNQKFIEFSIEMINYIKKISKLINIHNGGLICFDYGFQNKKMFNTLQSVKNHSYSKILLNPGKQDITHLINFSFLSNLIKELNLEYEGITNQGFFLKKMGIIERANIISKKYKFKKKLDLFYRLKRLIHPNEMGNVFKVIYIKKKGQNFNLGFN